MGNHGRAPVIGSVLAVAGTVAAYAVLGGLGVSLLGLATLVIAARVELEREGPVGADSDENLFAMTVSSQQRASADDRPAMLSKASSFSRLNLWAQIIGAIILMVGIALWRGEP